jgi:hypothetical protein
MLLCLCELLDDLLNCMEKVQAFKCINNKKMVSQRVLLLTKEFISQNWPTLYL